MTTELWEQGSFWKEVVEKECKCIPHEHTKFELPILHQYKLVCNRVLHGCASVNSAHFLRNCLSTYCPLYKIHITTVFLFCFNHFVSD